MKKSKRIIALNLLFLSFFFRISFAQQHLNYRQYMDNMGPINPTWYLSDTTSSINTIVRKQWVGFDNAPTTLIFNGHVPFNSIDAATGLNLSYDTFGPEKLLNVSAFFAKTVRLSRRGQHLSASLSLGVRRYEAIYSSLDSQDPSFRDDILKTIGTIGWGVMFYKPEEYFVGISMPQLNLKKSGTASGIEMSTPYYGMMGYLAKVSDVFKIKPIAMVTLIEGLPTNYDFSTTLYIQDVLGLGLSYGKSRELGTRFSIFPSKHLRVSYSYQFGTESYGMSNKTNNTHEIALGYRFGKGVTKKLL